jgi:hypothetical protein
MTVSTGHRSGMFPGSFWTWGPTLVEIEEVISVTGDTLISSWTRTSITVTVTEFTVSSGVISIVTIWT